MSRAELARALASLVEQPRAATTAIAAALGLDRLPTRSEQTDLLSFQLYPYASVHLGAEGMIGGEARDRIAGFLRSLGAIPPPEPDHLVVLLDAYAQLMELDANGAAPQVRHARRVLLHEHLWTWVPRFADRVTELGPQPYVRWARLLVDLLTAEVDELGEAPVLAAHLRHAPPLPDPRAGDAGGAFLAALLAPVRSGLIVTRADLARAADELGLGLRMGERAFVLRALLAQDADGMLRFLAAEADRQERAVVGAGPTAAFWRGRLATTGALLQELATSLAVASTVR